MQSNFKTERTGRRILRVLMTVCLLAMSWTVLKAQSGNARVTGTVTDPTGAAIPGATITLTDTDTNAVSTVKSSGNGDFSIDALPIGNYHAKVEMTGFGSQEQDLKLDVGASQALKFTLSVGSETTTINVTGAAANVDLASSDTGEVITGPRAVGPTAERAQLHAAGVAAAGCFARPEQQFGIGIQQGAAAGGDAALCRNWRLVAFSEWIAAAGEQLHPGWRR